MDDSRLGSVWRRMSNNIVLQVLNRIMVFYANNKKYFTIRR